MNIRELTDKLNQLRHGLKQVTDEPFTEQFIEHFVEELPTILMLMPDGYRIYELFHIRNVGLVVGYTNSSNHTYYIDGFGCLLGDIEYKQYGLVEDNIITWVRIGNHMDVISEYMESQQIS